MSAPRSPVRKTILELAARPEGVRAFELLPDGAERHKTNTIRTTLWRMAVAGEVFPQTSAQVNRRYFATSEAAAAWVDPEPPMSAANAERRAMGPHDAIMRLAARPQGCVPSDVYAERGNLSSSGVRKILARLLELGTLHRSDKHKRYFVSAEAAARYSPSPAQVMPKPLKMAGRPKGAADSKPRKVDTSRGAEVMQPSRGKAGCVLKVTAPHWRSKPKVEPAEPVTSAHVAPQILPSAPVYSRSQIAPGEQFAGLGLRFMRAGEYLEPASGWVKAVGA